MIYFVQYSVDGNDWVYLSNYFGDPICFRTLDDAKFIAYNEMERDFIEYHRVKSDWRVISNNGDVYLINDETWNLYQKEIVRASYLRKS